MSEDRPSIAPSAPTEFDPNLGLGADVSALFAEVADGSLTAQRHLRDCCLAELRGFQVDGRNHDILTIYAIFAARLAAAQGDYSDLQRLAGALLGAGAIFGNGKREDVARSLASEALSLFERMAERGDVAASLTADEIVGMHPELVAGAKRYMAKGVGQ